MPHKSISSEADRVQLFQEVVSHQLDRRVQGSLHRFDLVVHLQNLTHLFQDEVSIGEAITDLSDQIQRDAVQIVDLRDLQLVDVSTAHLQSLFQKVSMLAQELLLIVIQRLTL